MRVTGLTAALLRNGTTTEFDYSLVSGEDKHTVRLLAHETVAIQDHEVSRIHDFYATFHRLLLQAISQQETTEAPLFLLTGSSVDPKRAYSGKDLQKRRSITRVLSHEQILLKTMECSHTEVAIATAEEAGLELSRNSLDFVKFEEPLQHTGQTVDGAFRKNLVAAQQGNAPALENMTAFARLAAEHYYSQSKHLYCTRLKFLAVLEDYPRLQSIGSVEAARQMFGNTLRGLIGIEGNLALKFRSDPVSHPLVDPLVAIMGDHLDTKTGEEPGAVRLCVD